jgi:hypothetical protein
MSAKPKLGKAVTSKPQAATTFVRRRMIRRKRASVAFAEGHVGHLRGGSARLLEQCRRRINSDHGARSGPTREQSRQHARAAPDIQYPGILRETYILKESAPHRALLSIGTAFFQISASRSCVASSSS